MPHICRACGKAETARVFDLGEVPASDSFPPLGDVIPDPTWPLTVHMCRSCFCVQLGYERRASPELPSAVDSETAKEHARRSVKAIMTDTGLRAGQRVAEVDSSHGASWLPQFVNEGLVEAAPDDPVDLVVDVHYLMHQEDADEVVATHAARLRPGGVLVCEFFHLLPLVERALIDTFRHGHFVYLSVLAAQPLFARHGLTITRVEQVDVYGGSVRLTAARAADHPRISPSVDALVARELAAGLGRIETLRRLGARGERVASQFRERLESLSAQGRRVAGYGAPSKAAVLLALSGVDSSLLSFTVDLSPAKHGRRVPGAQVPILPVDTLLDRRPDDVVILTWDIADEIVEQLRAVAGESGWAPHVHVPLPFSQTFPLRA